MIPIQAHHTAYHKKYPSKCLLLLMQRSIGQIQAFPFDCLKQHCDYVRKCYAGYDIRRHHNLDAVEQRVCTFR